MAHRSRLLLIADYMKRSISGNAPTNIRYRTGLNGSQNEEIRKLLLGAGLLTVEGNNGNTRFKSSEKGREFLKQYREIEKNHEWIYLEDLAV